MLVRRSLIIPPPLFSLLHRHCTGLAAAAFQTLWRGVLARGDFKETARRYRAAVTLQGWARALSSRAIMKQLMSYRDVVNGAATKIECMARARHARKRCAVLRRIRRVDEANARTRRHEARCRFRMESYGAAYKVQRVFRSYLARRNFRQGVLFAKRYMMATKIAKTFRMYVRYPGHRRCMTGLH